MGNKKFLLVYNLAHHYRKGIFTKLDKELDIDFCFGDLVINATDIKKMDTSVLKGDVYEVNNHRLYKLYIWQKGVFNILRKKKYTHVILYGEVGYLSNWVIMLYCKLFGIKTALWAHGLKKESNFKNELMNKVYYSLADNYLLYGNYAKDFMISRGYNRDKFKIIYNSLDYEKQISVRKKLNYTNIYRNYFGNDKPVLIYTGRIQKRKKIEQVLQALSKLKGSESEFNFVIVGKDSEGVNLERYITDLGIQENIWLYGESYDEQELGNLFYNANCTISPGNIGLTAMHSLVYGTPAITHNNFVNQMPEYEAIIEGLTGGFFKENDIEDLTRCITYWVNNTKINRDNIRKECYKIIDKHYNPNYQVHVIDSI